MNILGSALFPMQAGETNCGYAQMAPLGRSGRCEGGLVHLLAVQ